jgi:hypothetical protein
MKPFFEHEQAREMLLNLYNERSGVLDEADEGDVDLTSEALQTWQSAIDANPALKDMIEKLPDVVYSTQEHEPTGFLREHDALCVINPEERRDGAQIICSMGLFSG